MWGYMKNFFTAFCSESSVHGVKYLIKDKNIVSRCYWCIMLIFALYCCGQFSILLSNRFLEIPVRMTIKNTQARTELLPLPSVTFCSENPSDEWYEQFLDNVTLTPDYTREVVLDAMRLGVGELTPRYVADQKPLNETLMHIIDVVLKYNNVTTREFVERVSIPCDVLLSHCMLRSEILPCGEIFQRVNGQCCRFYDDPKTFVSSGDVFNNNLKVATTMNYGNTIVMVHEPLSEPLIDQAAFTMGNKYYVMFYIKPMTVMKSEEVHELEEESGVCVHPDEQELRFFEEYDHFNCAKELMMNASIALCGCAGTYTPAPDQYTCNFTQMNCLRNYPALNKRNYNGLPMTDMIEEFSTNKGIVSQECPEACSYISYKINFKPRALVPEFDSTGFLTNVDPENQYVLHFSYDSQFYRIQEFVLIADWITLLSNLGGVYGLFLGCSMVTLAELAFLLWSKVISKMWLTDHDRIIPLH